MEFYFAQFHSLSGVIVGGRVAEIVAVVLYPLIVKHRLTHINV